MNRQERRRARALGETEAPENYEKTAQAMLRNLRQWIVIGEPAPRFRLPPKEYALIAPLDLVGSKLAIDAGARFFVEHFCELGRRIGEEPPTVLMLAAVLDLAGVEVERVELAELELGQVVGMSTIGARGKPS